MKRIQSKKCAKPSPENAYLIAADNESAQSEQTSLGANSNSTADIINNDASAASKKLLEALPSSTQQPRPRSSWYGTWPRKSNTSIKLCKESIQAETGSNNSVIKGTDVFEATKPGWSERPPSMCFGKSKETFGITMPSTINNENSKIHNPEPKKPNKDNAVSFNQASEDFSTSPKGIEQDSQTPDIIPMTPQISQGWFGSLLGRPNSPPSCKNEPELGIDSSAAISNEPSFSQSLQAPSKSFTSQSWLGWFPLTAQSIATASTEQFSTPTTISSIEPEKDPTSLESYPKESLNNVPPTVANTSTKTEGSNLRYKWSFWSKQTDYPSENSSINRPTCAIASVESLSHDSMQSAQSKVTNDLVDNQSNAKDESIKSNASPLIKQISSKDQANPETPIQPGSSVKKFPPNLLLPSLRSTYQVYEAPSTIEKITRFFNFGQKLDVRHLRLSKEIPVLKKAVVIGIHGLVPAPLIRTVIGQPTGTSIRFANHAADAIRRWINTHDAEDCDIEVVALEGAGKIADRVNILWKLLLGWIKHIQKADFTLVACHSQGVPVAIMLVAKLIEFGVVTTGRIGVCAMAGVSLGPFIDYKSRLIGGSAGELFEFADPESDVSKNYERSLRISLKHGVRVLFCGSMDDQLVSMESSIFSSVSHPHIYRAVFIDGRIHAPDFLSYLVGFALKLRNIGISDHGLVRELSAPLAGSLYTGEGHSRLYDDIQVYDLAVEFALETTSIKGVPLKFTNHKLPMTSNPYVLPWIMRGLLEEDYVRTKLTHETIELLKMFDDWKPATKVLKDVKYRLEVVKSKL